MERTRFIRQKTPFYSEKLTKTPFSTDFSAFQKSGKQVDRKAKKRESSACPYQQIHRQAPKQKKKAKGYSPHDGKRTPRTDEATQKCLCHPASIKGFHRQQIQKSKQKRGDGKRDKKSGYRPKRRCHHRSDKAEKRSCRRQKPLLPIGKQAISHVNPCPEKIQSQTGERNLHLSCRQKVTALMQTCRKQRCHKNTRAVTEKHPHKKHRCQRCDH